MVFYIVEAILWFAISYYWSKFIGPRSMVLIATLVFPLVVVIDILLFKWGFVWTASTLIISLLIAIPSYIAILLGIFLAKRKSQHKLKALKGD